MKKISLILSSVLTISTSFAQKTLAEGSIVYDVFINTGSKEPQLADALDGAVTTVYIKGSKSRTDLVNALGTESTIFDAATGNAVILKEYSSQKLMITLNKDNWETKNKAYKNISFEATDETKEINGYNCKKAIAKMVNGKTFVVYYTPDVVVANKDYDNTFKNLPGLPIQYEMEVGKTKIKYVVSKIDYSPITASKFDAPKAGFRVMTYEENQQMKKTGIQ